MATIRDWADGYLAQARADLKGAQAIGAASPSTFAMLLQMVFEKFAKAALLRSGAVTLDWARGSHGAASRMLLALRQQRRLLEPLGGTKVWEDVLWVVSTLEQAHPQLAPPEGPQLEYPWEDARAEIRWPARDLQIATALGDPRKNLATRVLRFAMLLSDRFDDVFP
ncbi:hypothetical protein BE21_34225 [Sorangium cellulosum]|uniref:HEPN domain-containing protein n=1 Tax=Sorangium cellulosum TaxID=56 RepID=A0A150TPF5_SORCE|nr:hypothetical protein BE21_34225 [Sorangium cellulosum]